MENNWHCVSSTPFAFKVDSFIPCDPSKVGLRMSIASSEPLSGGSEVSGSLTITIVAATVPEAFVKLGDKLALLRVVTNTLAGTAE